MPAAFDAPPAVLDPDVYARRIRAWTLYDWANSAFATTILAAILPVYFSQVAAANLANPTVATSYWSYGLSLSLLIVALLSPILGVISDLTRGKKRFLAFFTAVGIIATALLVLVERGDWVLASLLAIIGRIGFNGANSFYDALLPHVARPADRDRVSTRGYAMGYLGGGLLLAINIVMLQTLPGTWGARLSFVSVALWWGVFSIPLFRDIPEPPAATLQHQGRGVVLAAFRRLRTTLSEVRAYRELFKFLLAFLIYNDGIGTIIGIAAIYGAELGFGSVELVLALLLVQFVGIPYSLIFGRLPDPQEPRRPIFLAFILYSAVVLPLFGRWATVALPSAYTNSLPWVLGGLFGLEAVGLLFAWLFRRALFSGLAARLDTRRSILLSLGVYAIIAIWAYFLNSLIEFWFLAWLVAIVQGGSQALSRSLYSALTPAAKSGEFFGFFGIMEKFSAFIGPLLFAAAGTVFGSSRPAVISLIVLFIGGGYLLARVDVAAGQAVARAVDRELLGPEVQGG